VAGEILAITLAVAPDAAEARALMGIVMSNVDRSATAATTAARGPRRLFAKLAGGGCLLWHGSADDDFTGTLAAVLVEKQTPVPGRTVCHRHLAFAGNRLGTAVRLFFPRRSIRCCPGWRGPSARFRAETIRGLNRIR
jgi:hypothetical protein